MAKYQIIEPAFSSRDTANYKLSILPGVDSLVYMVYNNQFELLLLDRLPVTTDEQQRPNYRAALAGEKLLQHPFAQVRIALPHPVHTLVPERLFSGDENDLLPYVKNLTILPIGTELSTDRLDRIGATMVYGFDFSTSAQFLETFPNAQFYHLGTALLHATANLQEGAKGHRTFLYIHNRRIHVMVYRSEELMFHNAFEFADGKDFVYYAMLAYHQFELNPEHVPCILGGDLVEQSELYKLLYRYVRHLSFAPAPLKLRTSEPAKKLLPKPSQLLALYGLHYCQFGQVLL